METRAKIPYNGHGFRGGVPVSVSFGFEIDEQRKLITVTCDGSTSSEERSKIIDQLVEVLLERPALDLVLDVRDAEISMTDEERLDFGEQLAQHKNKFIENRTVFLTRKERSGFSLILSSAYVNGFNRVVEFGNKEEALLWLQGDFA